MIGANSVVNTNGDGLLDSGPVSSGTLTVSSGTLSDDGNARTIANPVVIAGSMTFASTANGSLTFDPGGLATPSTMAITSNATLTVNNNTTIKEAINAAGMWVSQTGSGALTLAGTGNNTFARVDVNGGTLAVSGGSTALSSYFTLNTSGTSAAYVQSGGTVLTGNNCGAYIGNGNNTTASFQITGGYFVVRGTSDPLYVGDSGYTNSVGVLNISNSATVQAPFVRFGAAGSVLNLGDGANFSGGANIQNGGSSGVLIVGYVANYASGVFNFNGGTLKAGGNQANFFATGATVACVEDAGGIVDNGGNNITIAQTLQHGGSGATDGGLVFQGAGTTILSGTNSYNGGTTINAGVLQLGNASALGAATGSLTVTSGTLDLHGFSPTAGDLAGGAAGVITSLNGLSTLTVGTANSTTYSGTIVNGSGTVALVKNGGGSLTLLGNNTYTGLTTVNGGTLALGGGGTSGEIPDSSGVALSHNATLLVNRADALDFTAPITGPGSLVKAGSGTLLLEVANGYSNGTWLQAGTLLITNSSALGTGGLTANGGTLDLGGLGPTVASLSGAAGTITNGGTAMATLTVTQAGTTTFSGQLLDGAGQLSLNMTGPGNLLLANSNTFSGTVHVSSGTITVAHPLALQNATATDGNDNGIAFASGITTATLGGLAGTELFTLTNADGNAVNLSVGNNGASTVFSGNLAGSGGLTKIGSGALTLQGPGGNVGPNTLSAGMLVLANGTGSALGSGALTLNGGTLAGTVAGGALSGLVQAGSGAHAIAPGAGLAAGQYGLLYLNGGLAASANTTLSFNLGSPVAGGTYSGDLINLGGSPLTILGGSIAFGGSPAVGDYRLFSGLAGTPANLNLLGLPAFPLGETYSLSTGVESGFLDLVVALSGGTWTGLAGTTSWASAGNWSPAMVPTSGTVTLAGVPTSPTTVTLDGNQSAGALVLDVADSNGYTFAQGASGALTLGTSAGAPIIVISGTHSISAPLVLAGSLAVSATGGASLALSGSVSEAGPGTALGLSGDGQLILSGTGNYSGGTTVYGGTLYVATLTALPDDMGLAIGAGGTLVFDPTQAAAAPQAQAGSPLGAVPEPGTILLLLAAFGSAVIHYRFVLGRRPF